MSWRTLSLGSGTRLSIKLIHSLGLYSTVRSLQNSLVHTADRKQLSASMSKPPAYISDTGAWWTTFTFMGKTYNFNNYVFEFALSYLPYYCYNNQYFSTAALQARENCIPDAVYVWGLSSLLVKINLGLLGVWTIGTYGVWADANLYSKLCRNGRKMRSPFRAAIDLSEAIGLVLGDEICAYSNSELARKLKPQLGLRYYAEDSKNKGTTHIGIRSTKKGSLKLDSTRLYGSGGRTS